MPSPRERRILLVLFLAFLAALKLAYSPGLGRNALDGDYYYQVARHVAQGDGLVTSVSLYHQGFQHMPHPVDIYPVWPLVLGWAGRLMPLPAAATLLPELLYLLDLVLICWLGDRLQGRLRPGGDPSLLGAGGSLTTGHLAALLLGTSPVFFRFTSVPYTEALAFAFVLAALLALDEAANGRWVVWAPVAGALAALAYLTRYQMMMAGVGVVVALVLAARRRRELLRAAGVAAATGIAVVVPWIVHLAGFVRPFDPRVLLEFGRYRETPAIERFQSLAHADTWFQALAIRLDGVRVAFDPTESISYLAALGTAVYLLPLALVAVLVRPARATEALRSATRPSHAGLVGCLLAGALMVAPLHFFHSSYLWEWRFGHRHGLPLVLVLVPLLAWLATLPGRRIRTLALVLVAFSILGGATIIAAGLPAPPGSGLVGAEDELAAWIDGHPEPPTLLTTQVHTLAVFTHARYHWMECQESGEKVRQMLELIPSIDYGIVYPGEERCPFAQGLRTLPLAATFGEGNRRILVFDARQLPGRSP